MKKLTKKQKAFVNEYLIDFNATAAAKRAGYSEKTAYSTGQRLLKNVEVKKLIDAEIKKRNQDRELKEEDIINELRKIAFSDVGKYYKENFELKDISQLPNELTAAIKEVVKIETDSGIRTGIKFYSKESALELLGKHLGIWKSDQGEQRYHITINDRTPKKAKA